MTDLPVADRVEQWMRENPGQHVFAEIARGVRLTDALVREALADDERFWRRERGLYEPDRAVVFLLPPTAADGSRRARKRTQAQKVEAVLADGRWHTAEEIHKRCGFMRLNSRIAELRDPKKRGLHIECERIPGVENGAGAYRYRLIPVAATSEGGEPLPSPPSDAATAETSEEAAPGARSLPVAGSAASSDVSGPRDSEESTGASDYQQLSLSEAA